LVEVEVREHQLVPFQVFQIYHQQVEVPHQVVLVVVEILEPLALVEIGEILEELVVAEQETHHQLVLLKDKMEDQV
tara:strand:- start:235 stop:462 length:228 start_codon:yes stop_codon:yes gene_type:complete